MEKCPGYFRTIFIGMISGEKDKNIHLEGYLRLYSFYSGAKVRKKMMKRRKKTKKTTRYIRLPDREFS